MNTFDEEICERKDPGHTNTCMSCVRNVFVGRYRLAARPSRSGAESLLEETGSVIYSDRATTQGWIHDFCEQRLVKPSSTKTLQRTVRSESENWIFRQILDKISIKSVVHDF